MRKNNLTGSNIALILGVIILISSSSSGYHIGFVTGNLIILGSLAYKARRNQNKKPSTSWRFTEVISIAFIFYLSVIGVMSGGWYSHPITYFITPLWIGVAYLIALRNDKKIHLWPATESKEQNLLRLEKLAELKEKGVISANDFEDKKKMILDKI